LILVHIFLNGCVKNTQRNKVYRVGIVSSIPFFAPSIDGFKAKMSELGYVESENIVYINQKADAPVGNEAIFKKFVEDKVDLILSSPTEASLEAKAVTEGTGIPIVFTNALIEGNKLVESVRRPGGNITGVRYAGPDISVKRLEILHEIAPDAKRIWLPYNIEYPTVPPTLDYLRSTAESLGLTLVESHIATIDDTTADLEARSSSDDIGIDAILLIVQPIAVISDIVEEISQFAKKHKLLIGGSILLEGNYGPAFSFVPDRYEIGELAAPLVDKIFKGTPAGSIPVVSPEGHLHINYKVIQELGLNVNDGLLSMADEIIR
jgi:putative ABC transport system substrate-binding protein